MAKSVQDRVWKAVSEAVEDAAKSLDGGRAGKSNGALSGAKGVAAGAGAVALVPLAAKGISKLVRVPGADAVNGAVKSPGKAVKGATSKLGDKVGDKVRDEVSGKIKDAGGPGGIAKEGIKSALPFGGGGDGDKQGGAEGVGKGRRMPVQQSVDVAVPLQTAYNQWTQFEEWPEFMHRVTRVNQEDECTVSFAAKIWGKTKEFKAEIETQRPDERIKWHVTEGITHTGVVTFHELAPRLTRIELELDVEPGSLLEKAARGMRHIKRAARGDLHRFKAFIEMREEETGGWRGHIEEGELVKERQSRSGSSSGSRSSAKRGNSGSRSTRSGSGGGGNSRARTGRSGGGSGGRSRQRSRSGGHS